MEDNTVEFSYDDLKPATAAGSRARDKYHSSPFGGWLLLFAIMAVGSPFGWLSSAGRMRSLAMDARDKGAIKSQVAVERLEAISTLICVGGCVFSIVTATMYFRRRKLAPVAMVASGIAGLVSSIYLQACVNSAIVMELDQQAIATSYGRSLATLVFMVFYFSKSKRVKRTFIF